MITDEVEVTESRSITAELPNGTRVELPVCPQPDAPIYYDDENDEIRFLTHDDHRMEYDFSDGVEFAQANRNYFHYVSDVESWINDLKQTHEIFPVGVYEHGAISYHLSGESIYGSDPWDYSPMGAVIALDKNNFPNPREAARAILDEYTFWCNGDVWCIWRVPIDNPDNYDVVGGFIGSDWAEEALKNGDV